MKNLSSIMTLVFAVGGIFCVHGAGSGFYGDRQINESWYQVSVASADLTKSPWNKPAGCTASVVSEKISFETDLSAALEYTPASNSDSDIRRFYQRIVVSACASLPDVSLLPSDCKAVITVVSDNNQLKFAVLANGTWNTFTPTTALALDDEWDVIVELDNRVVDNYRHVYVYAKKASKEDYSLIDSVACSSAVDASKVGYIGEGKVGDFSAESIHKAMVKIGNSQYKSIPAACSVAQEGSTIELLEGFDCGTITPALTYNVNLTGGSYELTGEINPSGNDLTIVGGLIGISGNANVKLAGGKYKSSSAGSMVLASGYQFAKLLEASSGYQYEVMKTSSKPGANDVVIKVDADSPDVLFTKDFLDDAGITSTDPATIKNALKVEKGNGLTVMQNYILGYGASPDATKKPLVKAVQNGNTSKVSFCMDNVTVNTAAGVKVKYRVKSGTTTEVSGPVSEYVEAGNSLELDLPTEKVKYYKLEIDFE